MAERSDVWAVVPVKRFSAAKRRLASVLDAVERAKLARLMVEDVLDTLTQCAGVLAGTIVVTSDQDAAGYAQGCGAAVVVDGFDDGVNAAIRLAIRRIERTGGGGLLVVPADIPQVSPQTIAAAAAAIAAPRTVAVAAARRDGGTNLLACRPADAAPLCFGPRSFDRHCRAARKDGFAVRTLALPELELDIDRPEDLGAFVSLETHTRTHAFLSRTEPWNRLRQRFHGSGERPNCALARV